MPAAGSTRLGERRPTRDIDCRPTPLAATPAPRSPRCARSPHGLIRWPAGQSFAGTVACSSPGAVVPARAGQMSTLPSRGPKRRLVPAARLDELLGGAATVGVSVGHGAAQLLDGWCLRCGLSDSLAFPAGQVVFGGLAGGEEQPARPSGAVAATGHRDHADRVPAAAPIFPGRAVLPRVPVPCAPPAAGACRAVIVAPGVGLELFAADAAGADNGRAPVPAVAGVVDQLGRLLDDRHLLDPAAGPGRVAVAGVADAGDIQVPGGGGVSSAGFRGRAVRPAAPIRFSLSARADCPPRGRARTGWQR